MSWRPLAAETWIKRVCSAPMTSAPAFTCLMAEEAIVSLQCLSKQGNLEARIALHKLTQLGFKSVTTRRVLSIHVPDSGLNVDCSCSTSGIQSHVSPPHTAPCGITSCGMLILQVVCFRIFSQVSSHAEIGADRRIRLASESIKRLSKPREIAFGEGGLCIADRFE